MGVDVYVGVGVGEGMGAGVGMGAGSVGSGAESFAGKAPRKDRRLSVISSLTEGTDAFASSSASVTSQSQSQPMRWPVKFGASKANGTGAGARPKLSQTLQHTPQLSATSTVAVQAMQAAKQFSSELVAAGQEEDRKRALMVRKVDTRRAVVRMHPREVDERKKRAAVGNYKAAGLRHHVRQGADDDLAYLAPTLIPVPGAFRADGSNPMVSHTAENILFAVKKNMILGDLGYTPQAMLPLYVRSTLLEKNGTTPGGDQTYDMMSTDRRYTHYMGRPFNRFEEEGGKGKAHTQEQMPMLHDYGTTFADSDGARSRTLFAAVKMGPSKHKLEQLAAAEAAKAALKEGRLAHRLERRLIHQEMEKVKGLPLSRSLVRLAFKDPLPGLEKLQYLDD